LNVSSTDTDLKHSHHHLDDTHTLPPLRLYAEDHEDLSILSAHLQDALLSMESMLYHEEERMFSSLCHRFCMEHAGKYYDERGEELHHRVHTGLAFHHVQSVHYKGFDRASPDYRHLNLLALQPRQDENGLKIHLLFAGESEIRLCVDKLYAHIKDLAPPYPAISGAPNHGVLTKTG
jgi:hypothetical protein